MEMDGSCWVGCTARRACLRCGAVRIVGDETSEKRGVCTCGPRSRCFPWAAAAAAGARRGAGARAVRRERADEKRGTRSTSAVTYTTAHRHSHGLRRGVWSCVPRALVGRVAHSCFACSFRRHVWTAGWLGQYREFVWYKIIYYL